jgi:hypothetical protein
MRLYNDYEIETLIDELTGIRGAADGAAADFLRKRDEALQRLRDRNSN